MKAKRIFAIIALVIIFLWIIATFLSSILNFPGKESINKFFLIGMIILPIILWVILWMIGVITGKKNVASFRSEEMEKAMKLADEIKYGNLKNVNENASEETNEAETDDTNEI